MIYSVQSVDMSMEMSMESMEIITMAVDKHAATKNYEVSSVILVHFQRFIRLPHN